jgi:hypothetical protein
MKKTDLINFFSTEITWCEEHLKDSDNPSKDYKEGFINGLKLALKMIKD